MATVGKLVAFDRNGETLRSREVAAWYITDAGDDESEEGIYVSLSATADLRDELVDEVKSGVTIPYGALKAMGYYRESDLLSEEALLHNGYIKAL